MSMLDLIFKNPQPDRIVNKTLYQFFMSEVVLEAQLKMYSEEQLISKLTNMSEYLAFLNRFNDSVVQEISDVSDQIYGKLGQSNDESKED